MGDIYMYLYHVDQNEFFSYRSTGTIAIDFNIFVHETFESKFQVDVGFIDF